MNKKKNPREATTVVIKEKPKQKKAKSADTSRALDRRRL